MNISLIRFSGFQNNIRQSQPIAQAKQLGIQFCGLDIFTPEELRANVLSEIRARGFNVDSSESILESIKALARLHNSNDNLIAANALWLIEDEAEASAIAEHLLGVPAYNVLVCLAY